MLENDYGELIFISPFKIKNKKVYYEIIFN